MAVVPLMWLSVCLIQALTCDKGLEGLFIAAFVDIGATLYTPHIPSCFFKHALGGCWSLFLLLLQQLSDDLLSGHLLWQGLMGTCWLWEVFFNAELRAFFLETFFYHLHSKCLMYSNAANSTLVTASMRRPSVVRSCPGFVALGYELLLVLLGLFALVPVWFLVYVALFIAVDLGQTCYRMGVYELVVLIKHPLPLRTFVVLKVFGTLPGSQGCIPLAPA